MRLAFIALDTRWRCLYSSLTALSFVSIKRVREAPPPPLDLLSRSQARAQAHTHMKSMRLATKRRARVPTETISQTVADGDDKLCEAVTGAADSMHVRARTLARGQSVRARARRVSQHKSSGD